MTIAALNSNSVAVITGAAAGIGLAISKRFASIGMQIVAVDNRSEQLGAAVNTLLAAGASDVLISVTDVSDFEAATWLVFTPPLTCLSHRTRRPKHAKNQPQNR